jgi:hypothetical protein
MNNKFYLTIIIFLFTETAAHAYLDPFSGSLVMQFLSGLLALILIYFRKLRNFIKKNFQKFSKKKDGK